MKELFEKKFRSAEILNNLFCGKSNLFCRKLIFPCNFSDEKTEKKGRGDHDNPNNTEKEHFFLDNALFEEKHV